MIMKKILALLGFVLALASCSNQKALLPNVSGKAGEVLVVIEKNDWEGALGNATRELLAKDCPFLVMREPLYSLANVTHGGFGNMFKVHRNIVYFDIRPAVTEPAVSYLESVWADSQCVVKIQAANSGQAAELLEANGERIVSYIEQAERNRVLHSSYRYEDKSLARRIEALFGGCLHLPTGYKFRKQADDFIWIGDEKYYTNQGIFVYSYPASGDESDFSINTIIRNRNAILQENVPGMLENSYMTTGEIPVPTVEFMKFKNRSFAQTRGYWEVEKDFMGGPFVSHSFYSPYGKKVIVAEAFVYAPKYDKRQYLRQTESLLYSWEWKTDKGKNKEEN